MQLIYSTCGSTKLWSPTEHFLVSVLVCECCDPSLCVSVWLLVKCMPCILITPQPQKSWAATAATIAILVNSVWKSGQWECGPRNRSTYQRTLWLKKIQREKKQHRHDITIGPEVAQRSWNTLNNTAAPRKHHGSFFFFLMFTVNVFFLLPHDNTWQLIFIYTIYTVFADYMKQGFQPGEVKRKGCKEDFVNNEPWKSSV